MHRHHRMVEFCGRENANAHDRIPVSPAVRWRWVYPKQRSDGVSLRRNKKFLRIQIQYSKRILLICSTPRDPYVLLGLQCITDIVLEWHFFSLDLVFYLLWLMNFLEETDKFRFLRDACLVTSNLKGSVGLILSKVSTMWISIPLDLSSRSFTPQPSFIRSRCPTTCAHTRNEVKSTSHTTSNPFPHPFSSVFWLHGTSWVFVLDLCRVLWSS